LQRRHEEKQFACVGGCYQATTAYTLVLSYYTLLVRMETQYCQKASDSDRAVVYVMQEIPSQCRCMFL